MNFPYITQIKVNNCYASKNFKIPKEHLTQFKHIILTGKNGSGKTTTLNSIARILKSIQDGKTRDHKIDHLNRVIDANKNHVARKEWEAEIEELQNVELFFSSKDLKILDKENVEEYIFSFFQAHRKVELQDVQTVTKEQEFISNIKQRNNTGDFTKLFKQYLVNKKVYEAFDYMNAREGNISQNKIFFEKLNSILRTIFDDKEVHLEFIQENFEFYIVLSDGRKITFNNLSEGFSAFLSVIMDLLMRTDLIQKNKKDFSYQPYGIVLIDEPETHLHISMQYDILPLLSSIFPKIQFIVATHSPAVISSLTNSIVYDFSSKDEVSDWILGSSFSELMISHFGLENEYSPVADKIIEEVTIAVQNRNPNKLRDILIKNDKFLTPSLRLEIESQIIHIENK